MNDWPPTPRADELRCKHCGLMITDGPNPVHAQGIHLGKHRCSPGDSHLQYGYNADPEGAECSPGCLGAFEEAAVLIPGGGEESMNEENEVWVLFEAQRGTLGWKSLMGIYDNEQAALQDADNHPQWSVEKWTVDSEAQA